MAAQATIQTFQQTIFFVIYYDRSHRLLTNHISFAIFFFDFALTNQMWRLYFDITRSFIMKL